MRLSGHYKQAELQLRFSPQQAFAGRLYIFLGGKIHFAAKLKSVKRAKSIRKTPASSPNTETNAAPEESFIEAVAGV